MSGVRIAILGATGAVGAEMLKILAERKFPVSDLRLLADANDAGQKILYCGREYTVEEARPDSFAGFDICLVAVGNPVSLMFTPEAVKRGCVVIDNSSAYRMDPAVPLIVPEVNPEDLRAHKGIIANPNCSTIIAMVALKPLHDYAGIRRMIVSTYQAVSGAGRLGAVELEAQAGAYLRGEAIRPEVFRHQIAYNVIPHIDEFQDNAYTKEEMKMLNESRKILHAEDLRVTSTCVRVPVFRSHSESIVIETRRKLEPAMARELLRKAPGVRVVDDPAQALYPMPLDSSDQDLIFVGRIREDPSAENSLALWVCGDQVRKGAATNAVQIAELLLEEGMVATGRQP
jgi:aspartate-semialdehyde dehydrogenase